MQHCLLQYGALKQGGKPGTKGDLLTGKKLLMRGEKGLWIPLLLILLIHTPVSGMQHSGENKDLLPGAKECYTRGEVLKIIEGVMRIAEEEIEKTAVDAGKEAASLLEGKCDYYKALSEELGDETEFLRADIESLERKNSFLKGTLSVSFVITVFLLLSGG